MIPKDEFDDIINYLDCLVKRLSDKQLSELASCISAEELERREE
jgi:hypothetical protein